VFFAQKIILGSANTSRVESSLLALSCASHLNNTRIANAMSVRNAVVIMVFLGLCVSSTAFHEVNDVAPRRFEGDLVPIYDQILETYGPNVIEELVTEGILSGDTRDGIVEETGGTYHYIYHLWPDRVNDVVHIPYEFGESFVGDKSVVEQALSLLERRSGVISFVPRSKQTPYLRFESEEDKNVEFPCWSYVGQQRDEQDLNLGPGCIVKGFIEHLVLHALGFWHTSSRWDRDDYVKVKWENIFPGLEYDFRKRIVHDDLGSPYDYASIMHFGATDYGVNDTVTMISPQPIGQLDSPSLGDMVKLRLLYQCHSGPRMYSEYLDSPCTVDCKCWKAASGCNRNDDACQGDLVCSHAKNQCVRRQSALLIAGQQPNAIIIGSQSSTFITKRYLAVLAIIVVGSGLMMFWISNRSHRRNYRAI